MFQFGLKICHLLVKADELWIWDFISDVCILLVHAIMGNSYTLDILLKGSIFLTFSE